MILSLAKSATTVAMMLFASNEVRADESRYDKTIEAAMIKRAQEKIGELRPTISFDQTVVMVTREAITNARKAKDSLLPDQLWIAPKPAKALPPMVDVIMDGIDYTTTASTPKRQPTGAPKLIWDKFDTNGNPIK